MKSIRDIYQWHQQMPKMPAGMTSLQSIEWQEQNSKRIEEITNWSFAGELLSASPAVILDISTDKITAYADYKLDYITLNHKGHEGEHYRTIGADGTPVHTKNITQVSYEILYEKSVFYDTLKLIQPHSMVEVEGKIIKASPTTGLIKVKLQLSQIKVIQTRFLHAELLDDKLRFRRPPITSQCFIATAAFGDQDMTEVIQLREFRDESMVNSFFGRVLISIYGLLSPPIAFIIKENSWLRKLTRAVLRNIVIPVTRRIHHRARSNRLGINSNP